MPQELIEKLMKAMEGKSLSDKAKAALSVLQPHIVTDNSKAAALLQVRVRELEAALSNMIAAWDVLKEGNYAPADIRRWLLDDMAPAIAALRSFDVSSPSVFGIPVKCDESLPANIGEFRDAEGNVLGRVEL